MFVNGWLQLPLNRLVSIQKGKLVATTNSASSSAKPYIGAGSFEGKQVLYTEAQDGLECEPSDVLMLWDGERSGLCATGLNGVVSSTVTRLRPNDQILPSFLFRLLDAAYGYIQAQRTGTGVPHVPKDLGSLLWVQFPADKSEQRCIAEILDTGDRAIGETEALISKLKHMKTGLMHDLLTRGLDERGQLRDPDAHPEQFKDSPLGRIPREWNVISLGSIAEMVTSGSRGWARYYSDEGPMFLRIGNLTREHINLRMNDLVHVRPPANGEGSRTRVREGDLLISITADLGIIGVIPEHFEEAYVNQHIALVRLDYSKANPRWVGIYLAGNAAQKLFYRLNDSGAKAGLNLPTISALPVALPDSCEQHRTAEILDAHDARIRAEEVYRDKLKLQKKGLMEDLLTGRVRVGTAQEVGA